MTNEETASLEIANAQWLDGERFEPERESVDLAARRKRICEALIRRKAVTAQLDRFCRRAGDRETCPVDRDSFELISCKRWDPERGMWMPAVPIEADHGL